MTQRLTPAALKRWGSDPASFIEECLHDPETGKLTSCWRLITANRIVFPATGATITAVVRD
jgi:hypothetical protein